MRFRKAFVMQWAAPVIVTVHSEISKVFLVEV